MREIERRKHAWTCEAMVLTWLLTMANLSNERRRAKSRERKGKVSA